MGMTANRGPVRANDDELAQLRELARVIHEYPAGARGPAVLMDDDVRIEIPPKLFAILYEATEVLLQGGAVAIVPYHHEMTTQEAADYLNVSRPYLIKILEEGAIPFHYVGTHRRVRLSDLEAYQEGRDTQRRAMLDEMTREAFEIGLYDVDASDSGE